MVAWTAANGRRGWPWRRQYSQKQKLVAPGSAVSGAPKLKASFVFRLISDVACRDFSTIHIFLRPPLACFLALLCGLFRRVPVYRVGAAGSHKQKLLRNWACSLPLGGLPRLGVVRLWRRV